jgi:hypothetical protein
MIGKTNHYLAYLTYSLRLCLIVANMTLTYMTHRDYVEVFFNDEFFSIRSLVFVPAQS